MKALDCEPSDVFKPQLFTANELLSHWVAPPLADAMRLGGRLLPPAARGALSGWSFVAAPMQIHAAVLAVFASFVAPFGEGRGVAPPTTRAHSRAGARPRAEGAGPSCGFGLGHRPALTRPAPRAPPHAPHPTRLPRAAPRRAGGFFASGFKRAFKMKDFGDTIPGHGGVTDRFDCQMIMAMFAYLYYWTFVARTERGVGARAGCGGALAAGRGARHACAPQGAWLAPLTFEAHSRQPVPRPLQPLAHPTPLRSSAPRRRAGHGTAPGAPAAAGAVHAAEQPAAGAGPAAARRGGQRARADGAREHHGRRAAVAATRGSPGRAAPQRGAPCCRSAAPLLD
jgi:hypothetical protein